MFCRPFHYKHGRDGTLRWSWFSLAGSRPLRALANEAIFFDQASVLRASYLVGLKRFKADLRHRRWHTCLQNQLSAWLKSCPLDFLPKATIGPKSGYSRPKWAV